MKRKNRNGESGGTSVERLPLAPYLEEFSKAVAEGHSHISAAVICGRAEGSASYLYRRPGVKERVAQLLAIKARANEGELVQSADLLAYPPITVTRNHIVNGLAHEARTSPSATARVLAWEILVDIYLLRAKNIDEVMDFYGWLDEEIEYYAKTGKIPERILCLDKRSHRMTMKQLWEEQRNPKPENESLEQVRVTAARDEVNWGTSGNKDV